MTKVLVLGGISYNLMVNVDEFPQPFPHTIHSVNSFHETIGSTGAGKAINLKRLGLDVSLYGVIGNDLYGDAIKKYYSEVNIPFYFDINEKGTDRHVNFMKTNDRLSIFLQSTGEIETNIPLVDSLIQEHEYIFLNITSYCKSFLPSLKNHQKEVWVDLHDYDGKNEYHQPFIDAADVIQFSSENITDYYTLMKRFVDEGKKMVICTHGSKGSTVLTKEIQLDVDAQSFPVVDTNGAGDAFFSGVLYGLSKGFTLNKTMEIATIIGGLAVTSKELADEQLSEEKIEKEYKLRY